MKAGIARVLRRGSGARLLLAALLLFAGACTDSDKEQEASPEETAPSTAPLTTAPRSTVDVAVADTPDACTLVTEAEAARVLGPVGTPVEEGRPVIDGQRVCHYPLAADAQKGAFVAVTGSRAKEQLDEFLHRFGAGVKPVADLGDEAHWFDGVRTLLVREGIWLVTVQIPAPGSDVDKETSKRDANKLAVVALGRLA